MSAATDVVSLLVLLRVEGPRTLPELCEELPGEPWGRERVEQAVATAWSQNLLSLDEEDRLVYL